MKKLIAIPAIVSSALALAWWSNPHHGVSFYWTGQAPSIGSFGCVSTLTADTGQTISVSSPSETIDIPQSTPTSVVKCGSTNRARLDSTLGLLMEGDSIRQNLALQTENFATSTIWQVGHAGVGSNPLVTADTGTAPDGTLTADLVQFALNGGTTTAAQSVIVQSIKVPTTSIYAMSFWAKTTDSATSTFLWRDDVQSCQNQNVTINGTWARHTTLCSLSAGVSPSFKLWLRGGLGTSDSANIALWGASMIAVPAGVAAAGVDSVTSLYSYLPNTTASSTVSADIYSFTTSPLDYSIGWSISFDHTPIWSNASSTSFFDSKNAGDANDETKIALSSGQLQIVTSNHSGTVATSNLASGKTYVSGRLYHHNITWDGSTTLSWTVDGAVQGTATPSNIPSAIPDHVYFGSSSGAWDGYVRHICIDSTTRGCI